MYNNTKEQHWQIKEVVSKIPVSKAEGLRIWTSRPTEVIFEHMSTIRESVDLPKPKSEEPVTHAAGGFPFFNDGDDGSTVEDLDRKVSKRGQVGAGITAWIVGGVVGLALTAMFGKMFLNWVGATLTWIAGAGSHVFALYLLGALAVPIVAAVLIKMASSWGKRNRG